MTESQIKRLERQARGIKPNVMFKGITAGQIAQLCRLARVGKLVLVARRVEIRILEKS